MKRLSPSRLNDFLGCEHRTFLDIQVEQGHISGDEELRPTADALIAAGRLHEANVLAQYKAEGRDVLELPGEGKHTERAELTRDAMRAGREVIHQACLLHDGWVGFADFLVRVDTASDLGGFSYEVHDAKLARDAKPDYIFQLLFYNEEVARIQGVRPAWMHLILGDDERPAFRPEEFEAYGEHVRAHFAVRRAELAGGAEPAYPWPVAQCQFCPFWKRCADRRAAEDHVSLVATLGRGQGRKLEATGITALGALATLPAETRVPKLAGETLAGLRLQAQLQLRARTTSPPPHELLQPEHGVGLARLPAPSLADLFFDFEGDPYWGEEGLEYLFGTVFRSDDGAWAYDERWATSRAEERVAFESWMDWVTDRLAAQPELHIYHYNAYEPTALKRLVARHGTRELEVDALLKRGVFVDLYGVVRQAMRVGVASYGLKAMEAVHDFARRAHTGSLRGWQEYLQHGDHAVLEAIAVYNEDDCRSTQALLHWLLDRIPEAEARFGPLDRLQPKAPEPPGAKLQAYLDRLEACRGPLTAGLPDEESDDDAYQRAHRIMFDLLGYHRREEKPVWWAMFARKDMGPQQIREEDSEAIGDLQPTGDAGPADVARSWCFTLRYPQQEQKMTTGGAVDEQCRPVSIEEHDEAARTLVVRRHKDAGLEPPRAVFPGGPYATEAQQDTLFRIADRVIEHGLDPCGTYDAALDLLLRRGPRLSPGTPPLTDAPLDLAVLRDQVAGLDGSVLVVQGPPGTGKTWTGARLAVDLMRRHKRVGICATSHKAIVNLLRAIEDCADEEGFDFTGWKKASSGGAAGDDHDTDRITSSGGLPPDDAQLVAGTAWLWARDDCKACVDVLFIDEAGQVALADAMAMSTGARSTVLLGDPQQLPHVSQGTHAHGSGASVLEHLLGEHDTVPPDRGVFLATTWRLHPDVCRFVSDTMYDGRLDAEAGCARQSLTSPGLTGTGLRMLDVEHTGNRQRAEEEAERIAAEIERLLDGGTFTGRDGRTRSLTLDDILVVAPYNAQVRCLRAALPAAARVGTVDKFQGQEAPIVFFSMTSSSGEDVPRGMDFLFSRNRLNVAVSRAQALAVVVCSPALLRSRCNSVGDMQLINMLCRFAVAAA